jgi:hypothetical protein
VPVSRTVSPHASVPAPRVHIPVFAARVRSQAARHTAKSKAKEQAIGVQHGRALGRQKHAGAGSSHHTTHVVYHSHPAHPVHPAVHWHPHVSAPKLHKLPRPQPATHGKGNAGSGGNGGNGKSH